MSKPLSTRVIDMGNLGNFIDYADMKGGFKKKHKKTNSLMKKVAQEIKREFVKKAASHAPYNKGRLVQALHNMRYETRTRGKGKNRNRSILFFAKTDEDKKLISWVNNGTGIYGPNKSPIVPVNKKFLFFFWENKGVWVKTESVRGQKGQKFIETALTDIEKSSVTILRRAVRANNAYLRNKKKGK